ncbi:threonine/serine exporter family protein, partial [Nocardia asiatica]|uniref:threonine/serine exporter family protein n=1 Tax=Nocardia asiatica TaxID=209252 RepID=UPI002458E244
MPVVSQAVGLLVADRQATADTIVTAPTPLQPIDLTDDARVAEVLDLAVRVGEVVLASGTGVVDTTTTVRFIAATYGLSRCSIDVTYDAIRIWADRGPALPPASTMRIVHYRALDFTRLAAVDRLTRRIRNEVVPPGQARAALDAITSAPHPYHRWTATAAWSLMAAGGGPRGGGGGRGPPPPRWPAGRRPRSCRSRGARRPPRAPVRSRPAPAARAPRCGPRRRARRRAGRPRRPPVSTHARARADPAGGGAGRA